MKTLTNIGGQIEQDGSINFITDSDGFCKDTPTDPTTNAPTASSTPTLAVPSSAADPESTVV